MIQEPTAGQCSSNADMGDGCFAIWYPQMGGYVGRAVVAIGNGDSDCFDVYVWHDGEFPFRGDEGRKPCVLHHCSPEQFIEFGEAVASLQEKRRDE